MRRHEFRSEMMTSNRPLEDWGKLIGDVPAAAAILDRFLESAEVIQITRRSFRLRGHQSDKHNALLSEELGESDTKPATSKTGQTPAPDHARRNTRKPSK